MIARAQFRRWSFIAMALAAACSRKGESAAEPAAEESHATVAAETAVALEQPFAQTIGAIGTVEARAGHFAALSAPAATRVTNVMVTTGQAVAKGQVLVELEQSGFQSALKGAQASLTSAQAARDRAQRLVDQGISPRRDLDQALAEYARAEAELIAARRMAELSILHAPISGVVTRMTAAIGASVDPAQTLVEIADPSALDVLLTVQPADAAKIRAGNQVSLHAGQRPSDELLASATVFDVAAVVDSATRSVIVRVRAMAPKRSLRIGETVYGEIIVATRPHALTVPIAALVPEGDGFKVFVVDAQGIAHATPVKVGGRTDTFVEILEGIVAGDRVVTDGAFGVEDGSKVVPAESASAATGKRDSASKP